MLYPVTLSFSFSLPSSLSLSLLVSPSHTLSQAWALLSVGQMFGQGFFYTWQHGAIIAIIIITIHVMYNTLFLNQSVIAHILSVVFNGKYVNK